MTQEATGPESLRLGIMRQMDGLLRTTRAMERGEAARAITDAVLAALLPPTVQEDGGWPEREADIAWLEGEREEHAHESGYMLDHELAEARSIVARIDRLLAIARSGSAGTAWQPIETAPSGLLLLWVPGDDVAEDMVLIGGKASRFGPRQANAPFRFPTHWHPLPAPPPSRSTVMTEESSVSPGPEQASVDRTSLGSESAPPRLTSEAVDAIIVRVLAEDDPNPVIFKGILHDYAFSQSRLEAERENVVAMIAELPDEFLASKGGGWSFLNLCMARDGRQWTGLHLVQERLLALAGGLGLASIMMPREMWSIFPGGLPYVQFSDGAGHGTASTTDASPTSGRAPK